MIGACVLRRRTHRASSLGAITARLEWLYDNKAKSVKSVQHQLLELRKHMGRLSRIRASPLAYRGRRSPTHQCSGVGAMNRNLYAPTAWLQNTYYWDHYWEDGPCTSDRYITFSLSM